MHTMIRQFENALSKQAVSRDMVANFEKWMKGPKISEEDKPKAQELWGRYIKVSGQVNARLDHTGTRAPSRHQTGAYSGSGPKQNRASNAIAGDPSALDAVFHNPYTFIPFGKRKHDRRKPTALSVDEAKGGSERFTGFLDLEVELLSPLLTSDPVGEGQDHKTFKALSIDNDVIVPATGVRGALRTLMTVLTNGTLGYVDEEAWLCQARDAKLGPRNIQSETDIPERPHLARIVDDGAGGRKAVIQTGNTELVDIEQIAIAIAKWKKVPIPQQAPEPGKRPSGKPTDEYKDKQKRYSAYLKRLDELIKPYRPHTADDNKWVVPQLFVDIENSRVTCISEEKSTTCPWQLKLSQRPINLGERRPKKEGAFQEIECSIIEVDPDLLAAYRGRYRHGDHKALKEGDLVWVEPVDTAATHISSSKEIKSLQWARWGRTGERLLDIITKLHPEQLPDSFNSDGNVDEVTDLFGQVPRVTGAAPAFAARIRCGNLAFADSALRVVKTVLAPLAQPHPGCASFYRAWDSSTPGEAADKVSNRGLPLRGFKVYRTTQERGEKAPWHYRVQGIYDGAGELKTDPGKMTKTVELLPETSGVPGKLRLILRALTNRELALLLSACSVDWRIGGGKPFGLGHVRVTGAVLQQFNDNGTLTRVAEMRRGTAGEMKLPEPYQTEILKDSDLVGRMQLWQASQTAVSILRYPRAVIRSRDNRISRGGHVWFSRHAQPTKGRSGPQAGLEVRYMAGELEKQVGNPLLRAQILPCFDPNNAQSDVLFGYDLFLEDSLIVHQKSKVTGKYEKHITGLPAFNSAVHAIGCAAEPAGNRPNREMRNQQRRDR